MLIVNKHFLKQALLHIPTDAFLKQLFSQYDGKIVLTYNFKSDARTITLSEIESSDLPQNTPPTFKSSVGKSCKLRLLDIHAAPAAGDGAWVEKSKITNLFIEDKCEPDPGILSRGGVRVCF